MCYQNRFYPENRFLLKPVLESVAGDASRTDAIKPNHFCLFLASKGSYYVNLIYKILLIVHPKQCHPLLYFQPFLDTVFFFKMLIPYAITFGNL